MPIPLKLGYKFKVIHKIKDGSYSMESTDVYRDFYSIGFFAKGNRLLLTPGKTVQFSGGKMSFIHKNLYHRAVSASEEVYETYSFRFKDSVVEPLIRSIGQDAFDELYQEILINVTKEGQEKVLEIFNKAVEEYITYEEEYNPISELLLEGYLNELFIITLREREYHFDTELDVPATYPLLVDALKYMEHHFNENPSLSQTAKEVGVSPSHLSKMFSSKLNTTYSRFLTEEKINHAQKLLVNTDLSMVEVASQSGFSNSNYFSDVFKKTNGCSPLKYRKSGGLSNKY